jgi:putative transposase
LRSLLEPEHPSISLRRQCKLLGASRSTYYYHPAIVSQKNSSVSRQVDHLCLDNPSISQQGLVSELAANGFQIYKGRLQRLLCRLGFAPFERKLAGQLASRIARLPSPPWQQDEVDGKGEQWILDFAYWPSAQSDLFVALLVDAGSSRCLAWGLSDTISSALVTNLIRVAMESHPLPLLLRSETFLPFLSLNYLRLLHQEGVSFMAPHWPEKTGGLGRSTLLAPLWKQLKCVGEAMRLSHSQVHEQWIVHQAILYCDGRMLEPASQLE